MDLIYQAERIISGTIIVDYEGDYITTLHGSTELKIVPHFHHLNFMGFNVTNGANGDLIETCDDEAEAFEFVAWLTKKMSYLPYEIKIPIEWK